MIALKEVTEKVLRGIGIMEQDYVFSLNYHSKNPDFKKKLLQIQYDLTNELFSEEEINPQIPESLTAEKAKEIRDFAREKTNKVRLLHWYLINQTYRYYKSYHRNSKMEANFKMKLAMK